EGAFSVVVGPRSAVFAPLGKLGLVVIDEEHESTYKQDTTPRYHAREVAIQRMKTFGGPVLLGSATPSLESFRKAEKGIYRLHELPERVLGLPLPAVKVTDLRRGWASGKKSLVTDSLTTETEFALKAGGQALFLLNRRGFHSLLLCEECGEVIGCPHCRISLKLHRRLGRLLCHYCGHQQAVARACPVCQSPRLAPLGSGTEQVEALLKEKFPGRTIDRMDLDTTGGRWSHHEILERLRSGATDILVGTQMIAKGLDFPDVLLVGVVNADTAMNLPDFRAAERTFCLLAQVAGRTGRGERGGQVVIQTFRPDHPAVRAAVRHDYLAFARRELAVRKQAGYPPFVELLNVIFSGRDEKKVERTACEAAGKLQGWVESQFGESGPAVVGPAPCPLEKLRGQWRWHLIVKSPRPEDIERVGSWIAAKLKSSLKSGLRLTLDRDPASLM
ncbi:MAG TPA: primosomal protein N', partial [Candidatus Glassbacteria bacterium]|nr:primosomal protein N' [Candidatus Glassbacteria bacterium]